MIIRQRPRSLAGTGCRTPRLRTAELGCLSDEDLVQRAQRIDDRALETLISRYRRFARHMSRGYYLVGGSEDDLEQEALIGLLEAVRRYRSDRAVPFRPFAALCMQRRIYSAMRRASSHNQEPLNRRVTISRAGEENGPGLEELLAVAADDPADVVVSRERVRALCDAIIAGTSPLELAVLRLYIEGRTYQQIGDQLGRRAKAVDNAIQRVRGRLEPALLTIAGATDDVELDVGPRTGRSRVA
jgi:RNA polymerase sporulation-specific sigma factor